MTNSPAHLSRYRRPLHPPFTHFPIAAYVLAAGFDVISAIGGSGHAWASELWQAGTFVLIAGLALCLMTMLSGFADLIRFEERQPAAVDHGGPCLRDGRGVHDRGWRHRAEYQRLSPDQHSASRADPDCRRRRWRLHGRILRRHPRGRIGAQRYTYGSSLCLHNLLSS